MKTVQKIEDLLTYPSEISPKEVQDRLKKVENCFIGLFEQMTEFTVNEKVVFLKLLSRCNDLMRLGMDNQMKALNLTPEKLKKIFEQAKQSTTDESKGLIATFNDMQQKADQLKTTLSQVSVKLSQDLTNGKKKAISPEQQRLKRSKWGKP